MKQKFKNLFGKSKQRALVLACATLACNAMTYAQGRTGQGINAINQATGAFKEYLTPVQNLLYAIAAIVALVGCFTIFSKLQNGDQDVKKTIMQIVGGCVGFIALAQALPAFFK